jgi:pimeloyl-ACP methyl ester carboxylesterase
MIVNAGSGPPVVFIAQLGTGGDSWKPVIDLMTSGATTVTYDRPGTGRAPGRPAPNPPLSYSAFADELLQLLDEHGVSEPVVLVGHSVGSLIARSFAGRHPTRTAGMVHIDGSIPRLELWPAIDEPLSPDGDGPDATAFDTLAGEVEIIDASRPPVPAAVISRTPGRWPVELLRADPLWSAYQRELARQWNAPLVIAENAGHQVPRESPGLVAYVVDRMVEAVRAGGRCELGPEGLAEAGGALALT